MKKHRHTAIKRFPALLVAAALVLTALLTSCGAEEVSLVTALMREPQKFSYEYEGGAKFGLKFEVFEAEDEGKYYYGPSISEFKTIEAMVDGAGLDVSMKYNANKDLTEAKMEMLLVPRAFGGRLENFGMGIWADINYKNVDYLKEYIKLPKPLAMGVMWDVMKGREYISFTNDDMQTLGQLLGIDFGGAFEPESFAAQQKITESFTKAFTNEIINIAGLLDTKSAYVQNVVINADKSKVYSVKITDQGFKDLLRSFVNIKKSDVKNISLSFIKMFYKYMEDAYTAVRDDMDAFAAIEEAYNEFIADFDANFEEYYPEIVGTLNEVLDSANKVKLLGNDGITLDISFSKEGFVTETKCKCDFVIDLRGYSIAAGERFNGNVSKIRVTIDSWGKYENINKKVDVKMPKITGKNTLSYSQLLMAVMERSGLDSLSPFSLDIDPGMIYESEEYLTDYIQEKPDALGDIPIVTESTVEADDAEAGEYDIIEYAR